MGSRRIQFDIGGKKMEMLRGGDEPCVQRRMSTLLATIKFNTSKLTQSIGIHIIHVKPSPPYNGDMSPPSEP